VGATSGGLAVCGTFSATSKSSCNAKRCSGLNCARRVAKVSSLAAPCAGTVHGSASKRSVLCEDNALAKTVFSSSLDCGEAEAEAAEAAEGLGSSTADALDQWMASGGSSKTWSKSAYLLINLLLLQAPGDSLELFTLLALQGLRPGTSSVGPRGSAFSPGTALRLRRAARRSGVLSSASMLRAEPLALDHGRNFPWDALELGLIGGFVDLGACPSLSGVGSVFLAAAATQLATSIK